MPDLKRTFPTLIACLALGAFGAGCGGDDEEEPAGGGGSAPAEEPTGGGAESGGGEAVKVDTKNTKFIPKAVTVPKGGTITWTNSDSFPHTVTKDKGPGPKFDSGNLEGGDTFEQTFDAAGKIDYLCKLHPGQTGTITVE
jgi:plastocyanin